MNLKGSSAIPPPLIPHFRDHPIGFWILSTTPIHHHPPPPPPINIGHERHKSPRNIPVKENTPSLPMHRYQEKRPPIIHRKRSARARSPSLFLLSLCGYEWYPSVELSVWYCLVYQRIYILFFAVALLFWSSLCCVNFLCHQREGSYLFGVYLQTILGWLEGAFTKDVCK